MLEVTTTKENNKLIVMLDASALKESSCIKRLFYNTVIGYRHKLNDNVIEFGVAFHLFRAIIREKGLAGYGEALNVAKEYYTKTPMYIKYQKDYLTHEFLWHVCMTYFTKYQNDPVKPLVIQDHTLIELPFAFPYYVDDQIEIIMCGTIDEIGKKSNGINCVIDAKTSGLWNTDEYFKSYKLSAQMLFYRWAIKMYATAFPDSWARALDENDLGCMIDGIFYAGEDRNKIQLLRSEVMIFKKKQIEEFAVLVQQKVNQLIVVVYDWLRENTVPLREGMLNGSCQTVYGPCKYFNACSAIDKETEEVVLEQNYKKSFYNPLNFRGDNAI